MEARMQSLMGSDHLGSIVGLRNGGTHAITDEV